MNALELLSPEALREMVQTLSSEVMRLRALAKVDPAKRERAKDLIDWLESKAQHYVRNGNQDGARLAREAAALLREGWGV